jgi:hypothetical protein
MIIFRQTGRLNCDLVADHEADISTLLICHFGRVAVFDVTHGDWALSHLQSLYHPGFGRGTDPTEGCCQISTEEVTGKVRDRGRLVDDLLADEQLQLLVPGCRRAGTATHRRDACWVKQAHIKAVTQQGLSSDDSQRPTRWFNHMVLMM